jgi:hypothetical protein
MPSLGAFLARLIGVYRIINPEWPYTKDTPIRRCSPAGVEFHPTA